MEEYRAIVQMVIEDNVGNSPEFITSEIFKSIRIAQRISGKTTAPVPLPSLVASAPKVSMNTSTMQADPFKGAILIGSTPPPPADDVSGPDVDDQQDYWRSSPRKQDGPERLGAALSKALPMSITLQLPDISEPVTLSRGISIPGSPMNWVSVCYTVPGQDLGPRFNVYTYQKSFDADAILKDISEQAACSYSATRKAIQPRVQPLQPPSQADIERLSVNGDSGVDAQDAQASRALASNWASSRPSSWR